MKVREKLPNSILPIGMMRKSERKWGQVLKIKIQN